MLRDGAQTTLTMTQLDTFLHMSPSEEATEIKRNCERNGLVTILVSCCSMLKLCNRP